MDINKNIFIYKLENSKNNKIYIGSTSNPKNRKSSHWSRVKHYDDNYLYCYMRKIGIENWKFTIIREFQAKNKTEIFLEEQKELNKYKDYLINKNNSTIGFPIGSPEYISYWNNRRNEINKERRKKGEMKASDHLEWIKIKNDPERSSRRKEMREKRRLQRLNGDGGDSSLKIQSNPL